MNCVDDCKYREMLDDANADLQELKAENAKLKNNNNYLYEMLSESRQANEYLHIELKRHKSILRTRPMALQIELLLEDAARLYEENAKLRELARDMHGELVSCEDNGYICGGHKFDERVYELEIEVDYDD